MCAVSKGIELVVDRDVTAHACKEEIDVQRQYNFNRNGKVRLTKYLVFVAIAMRALLFFTCRAHVYN